VSAALLMKFYQELPELRAGVDPDLWAARMHDALRQFRRQVEFNYTEGTLQRLLSHPEAEHRQAAVTALGLMGTMQSNGALARLLHDVIHPVARAASDALWQIWFRGASPEHARDLERTLRLPDFQQILAGLDDLLREAPDFAEVYNQRAIMFFRRGEFNRSLADCQKTLELNPYHFGAQAGMGECYLKLNKPKAAIRAFQFALATNPLLGHLRDTIDQLEQAKGG
jgi:tetratricopeptide (TPR) repeat protein